MINSSAWSIWRVTVSARVITMLTFLAAAGLIAARRPDQARFPEAWNEDGIFIVGHLLIYGWRSIFVPVNGYLIIPAKIVTYLALRISFVHYPIVSTVLGILTQACCVTIVTRAPTVMPARFAMAAALLFVPTDAEVFALPQYTLWWTSLLILVSLLWSGAPGSPWRYVFLIVGGVSSPLIVVTLPVLLLNAVVRRTKHDTLLLLVAVILAAIQIYFVVSTDVLSTNTFRAALMPAVIARFVGRVTWAGQACPFVAGLLLVGVLGLGVWTLPARDRLPYCLLGLCVMGTIASAVYRVDVESLDPLKSGPRYFFYPFVLELWMFIWLAARGLWPLKVVAAAVIVAVVPLRYANFQRHQERLASWSRNAIACSAGADTSFRVHFDGTRRAAHNVLYPHRVCEHGVKDAMLDRFFLPPAN